jgi:hypothetical protein
LGFEGRTPDSQLFGSLPGFGAALFGGGFSGLSLAALFFRRRKLIQAGPLAGFLFGCELAVRGLL